MKNDINIEYKTKDLGEAAALMVSDCRFLNLEKDVSFCWFKFSGDKCRDKANLYWSGELSVVARDYSEALRTLKGRLFAG